MANIVGARRRPAQRPRLSASLEDYLEAIARIEESGRVVRSKHIAAELHVANASVTGALRALRDEGFIEYEPYGAIVLTEKGRKAGAGILRTHETLRRFLVAALRLDAEQANEVACNIEHVIPASVMKRFARFFDNIRKCPVLAFLWTGEENTRCGNGMTADCATCLARDHKRPRRANALEEA